MLSTVFALVLWWHPQAAPNDMALLVNTVRTERDFNKRVRAVMTLIRKHDARALPGLKQALNDKDPMTRSLACLALSGYPANFALPLLEPVERDPVAIVKRAAAAAKADVLAAVVETERQAKADQQAKAAFPPASRVSEATTTPRMRDYIPPPSRSGPRLSVEKLRDEGTRTGLFAAKRELSLAAADKAPGWWVGNADDRATQAPYRLSGKAIWRQSQHGTTQKIVVQVQAVVEKASNKQTGVATQLLGSVSSEGSIEIQPNTDDATQQAAVNRAYRQVMVALVEDITDVLNVDRQSNGEPLLR